jgi:hypothetical protein
VATLAARPTRSRRAGHRSARALAVPAAVALILGLAGCSATNPMTTQWEYDPSDGVGETLGDVHFGNLIVLTADEGSPGTLVGFVGNRGDQDLQVTIEFEGSSTEVELARGETVLLGPDRDDSLDIDSVGARPGSKVEAVLSTDRGGSSTLLLPVLDGTLPEYADLVP